MKLVRIQTNRAKIKSMIGTFDRENLQGEYFVVPRPLPKKVFKFYVGFACVVKGSRADGIVSSVRNSVIIPEAEFVHDLKTTEHYWLAGDEEAYKTALHSDGTSAAGRGADEFGP